MKEAEESTRPYPKIEKESPAASLLAKAISSRGDWSPVKSVFASMAVSSAAAPPV